MASQNEIVLVFKQFIAESGLHCIAVGNGEYMGMFRGRHGICLVVWSIRGSRLHCYSILPLHVQPEKQIVVMEFLTLVNYGLSIGNFEMDLEDGEVRYKTSLDSANGELTSEMVASLVFRNLLTTDRYLKGLLRVLVADHEPSLAVDACKKGDDEEAVATDDLTQLLDDVDLDQLSEPGDD